MSARQQTVSRGQLRFARCSAWAIMVIVSGATIAYQVYHAVHTGDMPGPLAWVYGWVPLVISLLLSEVIAVWIGSPKWAIPAGLLIMVGSMYLSLGAVAAVVKHAAGGQLGGGLFGLILDAADLVCFQFIVNGPRPERKTATVHETSTATVSPASGAANPAVTAPASPALAVPAIPAVRAAVPPAPGVVPDAAVAVAPDAAATPETADARGDTGGGATEGATEGATDGAAKGATDGAAEGAIRETARRPRQARTRASAGIAMDRDSRAARTEYKKSVAADAPLSDRALGAKFGKGRKWGANRIREANAQPRLTVAASS